MYRQFVFGLLAASGVSGAAYADTACVMTYEKFETAVPHINLEECPPRLAGEGRICRLAASDDHLTVYVFAAVEADPDQCLVAFESYYDDEFTVTFKKSEP